MADDAPSLAVLFADVSGSTRLYETAGDADALAAISRCLAVVGAACERHGGRVVKTIGDELMAVFAGANEAAEAAAEMQARVADLPAAGRARLAIRVGFHLGPALEVAGDVFGDSVNVAARMAALAKGDQIVMSSETAAALSPALRARVREIDSLTVRGKHKDVAVSELLWQQSADDLTALATRPMRPPAHLRLRQGGRELLLSDDQPALSLGRDQQNDLVIADPMASRMHARIERRRDKFVLVDQSSNGTYVAVDGEPEIMLRHEEMILRGRGRIRFGHAGAIDAGDLLEFSCVD